MTQIWLICSSEKPHVSPLRLYKSVIHELYMMGLFISSYCSTSVSKLVIMNPWWTNTLRWNSILPVFIGASTLKLHMLIYKLKPFVGEEFNFVRHQVICGLVVTDASYDLEVKSGFLGGGIHWDPYHFYFESVWHAKLDWLTCERCQSIMIFFLTQKKTVCLSISRRLFF